MSAEQRLVRLDGPEQGVATIVLDNPPLNLVTVEFTESLIGVLEEIEHNDDVRAVVLTGTGGKAFCAGADVKEFPEVEDQVIDKKLRGENEAYLRLESLSMPVIAAIQADALGGGCELALACDLRVIDADASIGLPEVKIGVLPGAGGMFRLPEVVGVSRSLEIMLQGSILDAREAERIGLVNQVAARGEALSHALSLASNIAAGPRESQAAIKRGVKGSAGLPRESAVALTLELGERVFGTEDAREGYRAFVEKRVPHFTGAAERHDSG